MSAISDSLGNIFDVIADGFSAVVAFISKLASDMVAMKEVAETVVVIPNAISAFLWSPLAVCAMIVLSVSVIKIVVGAIT